MRSASINRVTKETQININMNLDGEGLISIDTGVGFLDHMLTSFAFHGGMDLDIKCLGDLKVDDHHTVEDVGIVLGQAFKQSLGEMKGIQRFGSASIPMDESLATASIDISNRPYLVFNVDFFHEKIGEMDTQNFKEFFRAFVNESRITLHLNLMYGDNDHHKIEAIFKAFAKAVKEAVAQSDKSVSSTKGVL